MQTTNTQPQTEAQYPCDICGQKVTTDDPAIVTDNGLTVEHTACVPGWFGRNYGREGLN